MATTFFVPVDLNLPRHRKLRRFCKALKIKRPQAIGHLVLLWQHVAEQHVGGYMIDVEPEEVAEACDWPAEKADRFIGALLEAGFLEHDGGGILSVPGWAEHYGKIEKVRDKDKERKAWGRFNDDRAKWNLPALTFEQWQDEQMREEARQEARRAEGRATLARLDGANGRDDDDSPPF
jgi:hypothetical protein